MIHVSLPVGWEVTFSNHFARKIATACTVEYNDPMINDEQP